MTLIMRLSPEVLYTMQESIASTALLQEDILPHLILQVVVKEENKDAQWAKDIVAAYHSDEFKEYLDKNNNGLWFVPEELFN